MPIYQKETLDPTTLPPGALLCLDIGTHTLGLALSTPDKGMALPHSTIKRTKFTKDIQRLNSIIREHEIAGFVLGWPLKTDGSPGPSCDRVRAFADEMHNHPDVFGANPFILLWDERFSTQTVHNLVDKSGKKMKQSGELDALAAHVILQDLLDALSRL